MYAPGLEQPSYDETHSAASRELAAAQPDVDRHQELTVRRAPDAPLTGMERLALASACSAVAEAFERAAGIWDRYDESAITPLSRSYRRAARRFHDEAALAEAVAVIAPAVPDAGW